MGIALSMMMMKKTLEMEIEMRDEVIPIQIRHLVFSDTAYKNS
jgi:hypothetical protein